MIGERTNSEMQGNAKEALKKFVTEADIRGHGATHRVVEDNRRRGWDVARVSVTS